MALDYKLHKATEKKVDEIVTNKQDIERREKNLANKSGNLAAREKKLIEDAKLLSIKVTAFESHQKQAAVKAKDDLRRSAKLDQEYKQKASRLKKELQRTTRTLKEYERALESLSESKKKIAAQKRSSERLKKRLNETKTSLEIIRGRAMLKEEKAEKSLKEAKKAERKAKTLLANAEQKNAEANGLKIKLGLRQKGLDALEKSAKNKLRDAKYQQIQNMAASRELEIKRKLLTKAYTQADIEQLDTKIEQALASEQ
jgi:hypothetical protein